MHNSPPLGGASAQEKNVCPHKERHERIGKCRQQGQEAETIAVKITEIRGYHVGFPLPDPVGNALSFFHRREFLLVEVVTDAGVSGWGEVGASRTPRRR